MPNPSIVGTPAHIASGGTYAPGAGSNRCVVMIGRMFPTAQGTYTLTQIAYNSVNRTPTQTIGSGYFEVAGICVYTGAELPGSAVAATSTWSTTASSQDILPITVQDCNSASPIRTGTTKAINGGSAFTATLTGLTSGDLIIAAIALSGGTITWAAGNTTQIDSYTEGDGDIFASAYGTASGTSATVGCTVSGSQAGAMVAVAIAQASGSSCTHDGAKSDGSLAIPDGSTGSYRGKTGGFVTPDCSTVNYLQPTVGNFGTSMILPLAGIRWLSQRREKIAKEEGFVQDKKSRIFLPSWIKRK